MAKAKKGSEVTTLSLLQQIVIATQDPARGYMFTTVEAANAEGLLTDPAKVESNPTVTNPEAAGEIAFRATAEGIAAVSTETAPAAVAAPAAAASAITIDTNIPIPARKKFGRSSSASKYPFEQMAVGNSFFIAGDKEVFKTLSSNVANQNKKYSVEVKNEDGTVKMREGVKRNRTKNADGTFTVTTTREQVPETAHTKYFIVREVSEGTPPVAGARVFRES